MVVVPLPYCKLDITGLVGQLQEPNANGASLLFQAATTNACFQAATEVSGPNPYTALPCITSSLPRPPCSSFHACFSPREGYFRTTDGNISGSAGPLVLLDIILKVTSTSRDEQRTTQRKICRVVSKAAIEVSPECDVECPHPTVLRNPKTAPLAIFRSARQKGCNIPDDMIGTV